MHDKSNKLYVPSGRKQKHPFSRSKTKGEKVDMKYYNHHKEMNRPSQNGGWSLRRQGTLSKHERAVNGRSRAMRSSPKRPPTSRSTKANKVNSAIRTASLKKEMHTRILKKSKTWSPHVSNGAGGSQCIDAIVGISSSS